MGNDGIRPMCPNHHLLRATDDGPAYAASFACRACRVLPLCHTGSQWHSDQMLAWRLSTRQRRTWQGSTSQFALYVP